MVHHPDVILPKLYSKEKRLREKREEVLKQIGIYLDFKHSEPAIDSPS